MKATISHTHNLFHLEPVSTRLGGRDRQMIFDLIKRVEQLSEALASVGCLQCPNCKRPGTKFPLLGGICKDCWLNDDDLERSCDFSELKPGPISEAWRALDIYAGWGNRNFNRPEDLYIAQSYACALGMPRILESVSSHYSSRGCTAIINPFAMTWDAEAGLVPNRWDKSAKFPKVPFYHKGDPDPSGRTPAL